MVYESSQTREARCEMRAGHGERKRGGVSSYLGERTSRRPDLNSDGRMSAGRYLVGAPKHQAEGGTPRQRGG